MKPLREDAPPSLRALSELVAAAQPHGPSPFSKRKVQARLARALDPSFDERPTRRAWSFLAAGALVAASAAAAGYAWLASAPPPASVASPPVSPRLTDRRSAAPPRLAAPPPEREPTAREAAPAPPPQPSSGRREVRRPAGEDPALVAEAVRALRKQGNPGRAQSLLEEYLKANPGGALAEDALALSIEAAAARKDARAAELARRYLDRYPRGRFRAVAERALAR